MSSYKIRTAAKALILKDDKLLLIKHKIEKTYYTLPGGGQNHNEELKDTVVRECKEELGANIKVNDLAFVFEYIADRHEITVAKKGFHQLDLVFDCQLESEVDLSIANEMDDGQIGYEWISLDKIMDITMYPMNLRADIKSYSKDKKNQIYLSEIK